MAISKQLKKSKMRKLFTNEIRQVKMKKNEKNAFCNSKKCIFFTAFFWVLIWLYISKVICKP